MVEGTPLLRVQTSKGSRGFESLRLRHTLLWADFSYDLRRLRKEADGLRPTLQTNRCHPPGLHSGDPLPAPEAVQPEAAAEATPETATFHFGPHALRVMMLDPTS